MEDLLGGDLSIDMSFVTWSIIATIVVAVLYIVIKEAIKAYNRKKEHEALHKDIDVLFEKYSDIFIDKLITKLNNKTDDKQN